MAKLIGIAIKIEHRGPMEKLGCALVTVNCGIVGDYRGAKPGKRLRQVTVMSQVSWQETCTEIGQDASWETRRANLLISDIKFGPEHVGKKLRIGKEVVLEITGETTPCGRMDEQVTGLKDALTPEWRGGVTCKVVSGGQIEYGDIVSIE
ncbi:MAG: hypothetical protein HY226_05970 [Candidatus Vogelbacteria bacterium]|nr:hypothetical protein [Candidatus Vogelbacteria bacterium]